MAVLVIALDVLFLVLPDRQSSETENRNLQQFPKLSFNTLTQGRFESQFDDYIADQFPGRDAWISAQATISRFAGNTLSHNIFLGKDGYLIQAFTSPTVERYEQILSEFREMTEKSNGAAVYAIIAPTAAGILKDKLPANAFPEISGDEDSFIDRLKTDITGMGISFIDLRKDISDLAASGVQAYYRTDHHWTTDSAYEAYKAFSETAGTGTADVKYQRLAAADDFRGTLSASSGYRVSQTDTIFVYLSDDEPEYVMTNRDTGEKRASVYDTSFLGTRDKYALFMGGNHGELKIQTAADSDRSILVIKDSYANCFIPFLISDFQNIIIIDPRYYLGSIDQLIKDEGITDILFLYNAQTLS